MFQGRIRRDCTHALQIGSVANDENVFRLVASARDRQIAVAAVGRHDNVTKAIGQLLQQNLGFVQQALLFVFREIEFRIGIVMIEDVLHAEDFERQSDEENVVRRVAPLDYVKASAQKNPRGVKELEDQRTKELNQVAGDAVPFPEHGVTVDVNPIEELVALPALLVLRTQDGDIVSMGAQ